MNETAGAMKRYSAALLMSVLVVALPPAAIAASRQTWKEPTTGMEFVFLKGGCFQMGSPENEAGRYDDEFRHRVCVDGYWMGRYEVTNRQFEVFAAETGYRTTGEEKREGFGLSSRGAADWGWKNGIDWRHPLWPGDGIADKLEHPVVQISWHDARAFVEWLNRKHRGEHRFRLPHESEWEYACRAGTSTARFWGETPEQACKHASVADATTKRTWPMLAAHSCTDGFETSAPVGRFAPNRWGLHDMLGNAWEWIEDSYVEYHGHTPAESAHDEPVLHVLRGGSWAYGPGQVRCAFRNVMSPTGRSYSVGLRVVKEERRGKN